MEWAKGCIAQVWWCGFKFRRMALGWKAQWNWFQDGGAWLNLVVWGSECKWAQSWISPTEGVDLALVNTFECDQTRAMLIWLPWLHWKRTPPWATASAIALGGDGHQYLNWSHQDSPPITLFPNPLPILSNDSLKILTEVIRIMNPSHLIPNYTLETLIQSPWDLGFDSSPKTLPSMHKNWKRSREERTHRDQRFLRSQVNAYISLPLVCLSLLLRLSVLLLLLLLLLDWEWEILRRFKHKQIWSSNGELQLLLESACGEGEREVPIAFNSFQNGNFQPLEMMEVMLIYRI